MTDTLTLSYPHIRQYVHTHTHAHSSFVVCVRVRVYLCMCNVQGNPNHPLMKSPDLLLTAIPTIYRLFLSPSASATTSVYAKPAVRLIEGELFDAASVTKFLRGKAEEVGHVVSPPAQ